MEYIPMALAQLASFDVILVIIIGSVFGTVIGALPGMGTVVALVVVLPFTFSMSTTAAIALLLSIYCSSVYGGSISAILINIFVPRIGLLPQVVVRIFITIIRQILDHFAQGLGSQILIRQVL